MCAMRHDWAMGKKLRGTGIASKRGWALTPVCHHFRRKATFLPTALWSQNFTFFFAMQDTGHYL